MASHPLRGQGGGADRLLVRIGRHLDLVAALAVYLRHEGDRLLDEAVRVGLWPRLGRQAAGVLQLLPELLREVRGERREQQREALRGGPRQRGLRADVAGEDHQLRDGRVEAHGLQVVGYALDGAGRESRLALGALALGQGRRGLACITLRDEEPVGPLQEAVETGDRLVGPGCALLERPHEHLVEAQRVRAPARDHVVRVHHVAAALRHLLRDLLERERLDVEVVGLVVQPADVLALDPARPELDARLPVAHRLLHELHLGAGIRPDVRLRIVGEVVVVVPVAVAEDHPGIEKLLEGLLRVHEPQVVEDLVPEARVEKVEHGVLGAAHVEVHRHPVAFGFP